MSRQVTLTVRETVKFLNAPILELIRALDSAGYIRELVNGPWHRFMRNTTVAITSLMTGDELEQALRSEFSSGLNRITGRDGFDNEVMESEGIAITNYDGDSVDLDAYVSELIPLKTEVIVSPKDSDEYHEFTGHIHSYRADGGYIVHDQDGEAFVVDPDQVLVADE